MNHDETNTRLERLEKKVFGNGELGIAQQNNIMWRIHVWMLCSLSAGLGAIATIILHKILKP